MNQAETEFLKSQVYKSLVWFRYIDDIVFLSTHGQEKLRLVLEDLHKCHPNVKFTHETNKQDIAFLDLRIKLLDGNISTDLFFKSTGRHQFLHYTFSHVEHTKRSIGFRQVLKVSRICSYECNFR